MHMSKKAQAGTIMSVVFATILIVAVAIPVTQDIIDNQSLTGTVGTVVGLIPLFLGLAGLAVAAALVTRG